MTGYLFAPDFDVAWFLGAAAVVMTGVVAYLIFTR